jgi:UDP-2,3-diacylglucosamine pyrophosphatase LpxH
VTKGERDRDAPMTHEWTDRLHTGGQVFLQPSSASVASVAHARSSLLVLSDMHLGSDIAEGASPRPPARSESVDDDLRALLDHYRDARADGRPWHLIINGDFIDFIGMSIGTAGASVSTEPSAEEEQHGLGTSEDHACLKLARVAKRHHAVFVSLARFVAAGHQLTIVPGNHDKEFHWERVKDDMRTVLVRARDEPLEDTSNFLARIHFAPWFFWEEGVAYIEHGHQYDPFCATDHAMAPLSPLDSRRLEAGFSDVLLRFVVHPTGALRQCDHDRMGVVDYLTFASRLGARGGITLFWRYVQAIVELFRLRRISLGKAAQALSAEHERRTALLAEAMRIGLDRLRALTRLQAPPVTRSIRGILASLLVDRLALGLLSFLTLFVLAIVGTQGGHVAWASAVVLPAWWLGHRHLSSTRQVDPQSELVARAGTLARLFPAAFVVMGHTHVPVRSAVDGGPTTYINTGSWAEEEGAPITHRATRTHLVIRVNDEGPDAELLAWDSAEGPKRIPMG